MPRLPYKASRASGSPIQQLSKPKTFGQKVAAFIRWRKRQGYKVTPFKRRFCGKKAWHKKATSPRIKQQRKDPASWLASNFAYNLIPARIGAPMDKLGEFATQTEKFLCSLTVDLGVAECVAVEPRSTPSIYRKETLSSKTD